MRSLRPTRLLVAALCAGALVLGCFFGIDPNTSRFECAVTAECGPNFECRPPKLAGGGLCYLVGECGAEVCDGADNDCNGAVDDAFDFVNDPQNCGACGTVCGAGSSCSQSACHELSCSDGADNDLDGQQDCLDLDCPLGGECGAADGGFNCGRQPVDAGVPDAGLERACVLRETSCGNSQDEDRDGLFDCTDPDCDGRTCGPSKTCQSNGSCI